jgi:GT2 family glycosyltransferase
MEPKFSIVIPVKEVNDYVRETVPYLLDLDDDDWELLIVTNDQESNPWSATNKVRMLSSGRVGPADKRDQAAKVARGEILVFLDDDSYPQRDLLTVARRYFSDPGIAAIGGPAITPPTDTFKQKVSGAVFMSKLTGGSPERYLPVGQSRDVDDWPSVNLMVRRSAFIEVNGFDSPYWPGEDTFLCLKLVRRNHRIVYAPDLVVWHHRREGLTRHMKQVGAYGLHRGYFVRKYPETSFRAGYFVPAAFVVFVLATPLAFVLPAWCQTLVVAGWSVYVLGLLLGVIDLARKVDVKVALGALPYIVATHISYGCQFLRGITYRGQLVSKLR